MTTHDRDIVSALRETLADRLGQERFDLWFGQSTALSFDGRRLSIAGPEKTLVDWIRVNFRPQVESACTEILGVCPAIEYIVNPLLADHHLEPTLSQPVNGATTADLRAARPAARPARHVGANVGDKYGSHNAASNRKAVGSNGVGNTGQGDRGVAGRGGSEGPCNGKRRFAELGAFIAGETNRLALTSAEMAAHRQGQPATLMFHGPTAVGKTHLLEGIWHAARRGPQRRMAVYLSAEQFTTQFLEALRGSGLPSFRRKYRGVDLLLIDDLQFFVGKKSTQVELLYTIDTLMREGRQLVFAADRPAAELPELGPELTTRLQCGMVCRVEPPDYHARLAIIAQLARRHDIDVPEEVAEFIAARVASHVRALSGALWRLHAARQATGRPVTVPLAAEILTDLIQEHARLVRLPDIEKAVCAVFGLSPSTLQDGAKGQRVSHPRMLAMWLARKHTRAALSEIGQFFGRRSHSTVVSAQRRVEDWMNQGGAIRLAHQAVSVNEAVRQVERRLAAG